MRWPSQPEARQLPSPALDTTTAEAESDDNFHDSIFPPPGRQKLLFTRSQKRNSKWRHHESLPEREPTEPGNALDISADELRVLQEQDETLHRARVIADGGPNVNCRGGICSPRWSSIPDIPAAGSGRGSTSDKTARTAYLLPPGCDKAGSRHSCVRALGKEDSKTGLSMLLLAWTLP